MMVGAGLLGIPHDIAHLITPGLMLSLLLPHRVGYADDWNRLARGNPRAGPPGELR